MSDALHATSIHLRFENMMKAYLPPVDPDGFHAIYSAEMILRINTAFKAAVAPPTDDDEDDRAREQIVSEAWVC